MENKSTKVYGVVVDTDNNGNFKVILAEVSGDNWQFSGSIVNEEQLKGAITGDQVEWLNAGINEKNGRVRGTAGDFKRFSANKKSKPIVILSRLETSDKRLVGYRVATSNAAVKRITLKEMLAYAERANHVGDIPVQNAIFVPADADRRAHFKAYSEHEFIVETLVVNKVKPAVNTAVNIKKNEATLSRLEEIFTKEQITELRHGKQQGVDIRVYANPELSPRQMKVLRQGLNKGINVKPYASPEYSVIAMIAYSDFVENGIDIRNILNPQYTLEQLAELSLAVDKGLDVSKMANPKLTTMDMQEIRERLEMNMFREYMVKKDGSWR